MMTSISYINRDDINIDTKEVRKSNISNRENEIQLGATNDVEIKRRSHRKVAPKSNVAVSKRSRARDNVSTSLGGILASLSLIDNNSENCGIDIDMDACEKKSRRVTASRICLSKQNKTNNRETHHRRESCLSVMHSPIMQQTPEKLEGVDEKLLEVPLESSSSMILFPSLVAGTTNGTQSKRPQVTRRATKIHRFTSMMTPSPIRDIEYHLPSTVRIRSSPALPSPLGENPSPRHFRQFRNEIKSPSVNSTFFSSGISGGSKTTEEEAEGEAEEDTSVEISIYRAQKNQIRGENEAGSGDEDENEESEICSDEEYQPTDTESDVTAVDKSKYKSDLEETSYEDGIISESSAGLSTSDYNLGPADSDTETEEDNSEQDRLFPKNNMTQNCTFPTASITLSTGRGEGIEDADLVEMVVLDDGALADEDSDQGKTVLASVDECSSEVEYSLDTDHENNDDNETNSIYSKEEECNNNQSFIRVQDTEMKRASYLSKKNSIRIRGKHVVKRGKWTLGSQIGSGSFGVVHVGMNSRTGNLMAVKSLNIPSSSSNEVMEDLQREIGLMRTLSHPNIVRYIGAETDTVKHILHIFQEWVPGGSLSSLLRKFGPFPLPVVRSYLFQIFSGLKYLHSNRILHRDIKGGNVLVNDEGIVKLADFGASKRIELSENGSANDMEDMMETMTMRGTPYFMAPEVFFCKYGSKADIWSSGGVAYQMCTGKAPWKDLGLRTPMSLFTYLRKHTGPPLISQGGSTCDKKGSKSPLTCKDLQDLLEKCFHRDPTKRPTAHESLQHCFFTQVDPNESLVEDESVVGSIMTALHDTRCPISPISPISPVQIIEMKRTSTNGKVDKSMQRKNRDSNSHFETSDWPIWGKEEILRRKDNIPKDQNPFAKS